MEAYGGRSRIRTYEPEGTGLQPAAFDQTLLFSLMAIPLGFEPRTYELTARCSTAELWNNMVLHPGIEPRFVPYKRTVIPLH